MEQPRDGPAEPVVSFFKVARCTPQSLPANAELCFAGIPSDRGCAVPGPRSGPSKLRRAANATAFRAESAGGILCLESGTRPFLNRAVFDLGDLVAPGDELGAALAHVEHALQRVPRACATVLIGGDHAFTLAALRARFARDEPFHLVVVDQHLDLQLWGEVAATGRPVLQPLTHANVVSHALDEFTAMRVTHAGVHSFETVRTLSPHDEDALLRYVAGTGAKITDMQLEADWVSAFARLPSNEPVYLTIDVDVLASSVVSETAYPAPGGISAARLNALVADVIRRNDVRGIDLMEFGRDGDAGMAEARLCAEILGRASAAYLRKGLS